MEFLAQWNLCSYLCFSVKHSNTFVRQSLSSAAGVHSVLDAEVSKSVSLVIPVLVCQIKQGAADISIAEMSFIISLASCSVRSH